MKKIRWGVIGAGGIAHRRTLPVFRQASNSALTVIMDVKGIEELGRTYNVEATDSVEAVLGRDDVDAVYIATPVQVHAEQVTAAAKAGKHVLCEKPLARSLAEAKPAAQACLEAGVLLQPAYMLRHHGAHQEILRLLSAGEVGKPIYVNAEWSFDYPAMAGSWRQVPGLGGGGSLADVGCHMFDLLEMFLGPIARVACRAGTMVQDYPVEDFATVLLEFEGGVQGTVAASFALPGSILPTRFHIYGAAGAIHADGTMTQSSDGEATIYRERGGGGEQRIAYPQVNTYVRQIESLAERILKGEKPNAKLIADALRSAAILDACYESAKSGAFVDIVV